MQLDVAWSDYVHQFFDKRTSKIAARQRLLLFALSSPEPVPRSKLITVTAEVAKAYASKTGKTLTRDLNLLMRVGFVERKGDGYRAKRQIMLAFRPMRKRPPAAAGPQQCLRLGDS